MHALGQLEEAKFAQCSESDKHSQTSCYNDIGQDSGLEILFKNLYCVYISLAVTGYTENYI